jgi:hypothetical protein
VKINDGVQKISSSGMHKELPAVGLLPQKQERLYLYTKAKHISSIY